MLRVSDLGRAVKQKFPGAYDDLEDADLGRRVRAKYPAYSDYEDEQDKDEEPTPIPEHEARWAWEWMASWGLIDGAFDLTAQIDRSLEREAHELAAAVRAG